MAETADMSHEAVAELARRALAGADLAGLFADGARTVAQLTGADPDEVASAFDRLWSDADATSVAAPLGLDDRTAAFVSSVAGVLAGAVAAQREQEAARRQSLHDALTGLPNRALAADRLARAIERRPPDGIVAVFVVDLDDFRLIDDSHGRTAGDEVLVEVARRLTDAVGSAGTVARLGADTFTITYEAGTPEEVERAADAVHRCFDEPFPAAVAEVFTSASIGIAVIPDAASSSANGGAATSADALLHDADVALYAAKQSGHGRRELFRSDMRVEALERLEMRNAMRRALERGEFKVWFQPEIALDGDRVVACEALVRWEHTQLGVVSPASFIPLAEESGLIVPLGEWIIGEACSQLRAWRDAGVVGDDFGLAVNLSTRQVSHPRLPDVVRGALEQNGLEPRSLWIEVNESTLLGDVESAHRGLEALHDIGVVIGVDDFGTGYSSLSYLRRFPVDFLKVDRSFVSGLGRDTDDEAIVGAVVAMARNLGLIAIAEGVETAHVRAALARLGCDMAQGYLWSPPLPALEATDWLARRAKEEAERPAPPAARAAPLRTKRARGRKPAGAVAKDADESAVVAAETTRGLLRVATGEEAVGLLIAAVGRLGGQVMPARLGDPRGLPHDLSLGHGEPIQPVAEVGAPARDALERVLPALLDDARLAVERLATDSRPGDGEIDSLTGLLTRRAVGRVLGRVGSGAALVLVDIDGIGPLRDRNPAKADAVLRSLSRLLRERLRGADKGGRFADDQLLLLLPARTADDATALLERTRRLWRRVRPEPLTLSVAVGVVGDRGPQFSLVAVDQALGRAREAGGDRIEFAT